MPNPTRRGEVLLLKRSSASTTNPDMMEGPGGKVRVDKNFRLIETPRQAAIKETREECGLLIDVVTSFIRVTEDTRIILDGQYQGREFRPSVALARFIGGSLDLSHSKQHIEGDYFDIDEALARDDLTIPTRVGIMRFAPSIRALNL